MMMSMMIMGVLVASRDDEHVDQSLPGAQCQWIASTCQAHPFACTKVCGAASVKREVLHFSYLDDMFRTCGSLADYCATNSIPSQYFLVHMVLQ